MSARGAVRAILLHPDARLRVRCAPVDPGADMEALARDLLATMYAAEGRGLAAPQVGETARVFVMDAGWKTGPRTPVVMVNPRMLQASPEREAGEERCLSIPDRPVVVARPARVRMAWQDADGAGREAWLEGAAARIAQHELDHLDGRLIVDG